VAVRDRLILFFPQVNNFASTIKTGAPASASQSLSLLPLLAIVNIQDTFC